MKDYSDWVGKKVKVNGAYPFPILDSDKTYVVEDVIGGWLTLKDADLTYSFAVEGFELVEEETTIDFTKPIQYYEGAWLDCHYLASSKDKVCINISGTNSIVDVQDIRNKPDERKLLTIFMKVFDSNAQMSGSVEEQLRVTLYQLENVGLLELDTKYNVDDNKGLKQLLGGN